MCPKKGRCYFHELLGEKIKIPFYKNDLLFSFRVLTLQQGSVLQSEVCFLHSKLYFSKNDKYFLKGQLLCKYLSVMCP